MFNLRHVDFTERNRPISALHVATMFCFTALEHRSAPRLGSSPNLPCPNLPSPNDSLALPKPPQVSPNLPSPPAQYLGGAPVAHRPSGPGVVVELLAGLVLGAHGPAAIIPPRLGAHAPGKCFLSSFLFWGEGGWVSHIFIILLFCFGGGVSQILQTPATRFGVCQHLSVCWVCDVYHDIKDMDMPRKIHRAGEAFDMPCPTGIPPSSGQSERRISCRPLKGL